MKQLQEIETSGWLIKVGDVYSNGYSEFHLKVTGIEQEEGDSPDDTWIHCDFVDPNDYNTVVDDYDKHRAWYINECWFLEKRAQQETPA